MKKAIFVALALLTLVFWGESVLELLAEGLEIVLETLELLMERFLEAVLSLTPHEAQVVTAWLGFGIFALLLIFGLRKLTRWWEDLNVNPPAWWGEEKERLAAMRSSLGWPLVLIVLVALLILVYM